MEIFRSSATLPQATAGTLRGYFAVFGRATYIPDMGAFESIARGAFSPDDFHQGDVFAAFNHGDEPIGRLSAGTLRLEQDDRGLRYEIDLPDTALGRDVATLVARGDLRGASFRALALDHRELSRNHIQRTRLGLIEGSVVTTPAYAGTSAALARDSRVPSNLALRHRALGLYLAR